MAEAIGLAIVSAVATEAAATTVIVGSLTVAGAVGGATLLAGGVALNLIGQAIQGDQNKVAAQQFSSRQPLPSRQRSYGTVKLGGPKVQYEVAGGAFIYANYHGEGPIDSYREVWLDDIRTNLPVGTTGGLITVVPWRNYVGTEHYLGQPLQNASPGLLRTVGWDANHHLNGCAYSVVVNTLPAEKKFKAYYPKQTWSEVRVVIRAAKVRNPAVAGQTEDPATWAWTDYSGPCIRDFIMHPVWGMRVPAVLLNDAKWTHFSGLCGSLVASKDGQTYPRYFLSGTYQLTDDPADTLVAMLATCDGTLTLEPDGTIGITGGEFPTPTVTISDPNIISINIEKGGSKLFTYNRLKLSYVSPLHDYQQVEGQAWDDLSSQVESGELIEQPLSLPWVQNFNQARRLAKIAMAKGNPKIKITGMVTDLTAAAALFEDSIRLQLSLHQIDETMIITRAVANIEAGTCTFDMQSLDPAAYAFDPATEEGVAPALPDVNSVDSTPAPPNNLVVSIERKAVSGSTTATFLRMTATPTDRQDLSLIGRYRVVGDDTWSTMVADTDDAFSLISGVLIDGTAYEAQGAVSTYGQALVSNYLNADPDPITAVADPVAPDQPSGFVTNGGAGRVMLAWTNSGSSNYAGTREFRGTTSDFSKATRFNTVAGGPNQAGEDTDNGLQPGTYYYWLEAVNGSGKASDPIGPMTATVI